MERISSRAIGAKRNIINTYEQKLAKLIAQRVVGFPEFTAWHFCIPILILFSVLKFRRGVAIISLNILFTKELALEAAFAMMNQGQDRQASLARIEDKTTSILEADKQGIYSERIRKKQMFEINLLLDHYLQLLNSEGESYEDLVKNAYQTRDNYEAFLRELTSAEEAVNRAAILTVGKTEITTEIISKMRTTADEIRQGGAEKIFSV
jgi:hypothetical protein